jgi:hypothetical protein
MLNAITEVRSDQIGRDREKEHALKEKEREEQLLFEKRKFELKLEYEQKLDKTRKSQRQGHAHESKPLKIVLIPNFQS